LCLGFANPFYQINKCQSKNKYAIIYFSLKNCIKKITSEKRDLVEGKMLRIVGNWGIPNRGEKFIEARIGM